jgi:hypothetical protein
VTYAAEPEGYHLAEVYFYDLLELAPNAYLSDLYVSSAVQALFDKTRARFLRERQDLTAYDEFGNPRVNPENNPTPGVDMTHKEIPPSPNHQPNSGGPKNPQPEMNPHHKIWPWVVVGVGVAAGIGVYLWISNQKAKTKVIEASVTGVTIPLEVLN